MFEFYRRDIMLYKILVSQCYFLRFLGFDLFIQSSKLIRILPIPSLYFCFEHCCLLSAGSHDQFIHQEIISTVFQLITNVKYKLVSLISFLFIMHGLRFLLSDNLLQKGQEDIYDCNIVMWCDGSKQCVMYM